MFLSCRHHPWYDYMQVYFPEPKTLKEQYARNTFVYFGFV